VAEQQNLERALGDLLDIVAGEIGDKEALQLTGAVAARLLVDYYDLSEDSLTTPPGERLDWATRDLVVDLWDELRTRAPDAFEVPPEEMGSGPTRYAVSYALRREPAWLPRFAPDDATQSALDEILPRLRNLVGDQELGARGDWRIIDERSRALRGVLELAGENSFLAQVVYPDGRPLVVVNPRHLRDFASDGSGPSAVVIEMHAHEEAHLSHFILGRHADPDPVAASLADDIGARAEELAATHTGLVALLLLGSDEPLTLRRLQDLAHARRRDASELLALQQLVGTTDMPELTRAIHAMGVEIARQRRATN
jgi:hypothetical protein